MPGRRFRSLVTGSLFSAGRRGPGRQPDIDRLLEENDLLHVKLEAVPDGVLVVDENWRMVYFNRHFVELWDIPDHIRAQRDDRESLQVVLGKLVNPQEFLRRVEYLMRNREISCRDELELRDGRIIERYTAPLVARTGAWRGRISFFRDITHRKQAEADRLEMVRQRRQLEKVESLRTMAAAVAHNYNNFLAVILGNMELALRGREPGTVERHLDEGVAAALKAARMGRQLLLYLGEACPEMHRIDCSRQVEEIMGALAARIPPPVRWRTRTSGLPPVHCECDADFLADALATLVDNSVEAMMPGGGEIEVSVQAERPAERKIFWPEKHRVRAETMCRITVRDTGPGMAREEMRRIFDPFYSSRAVGRGLGLSTVLGVARIHDGTVGVESELGGGTAVHLFLPLGDREDEPAAPA